MAKYINDLDRPGLAQDRHCTSEEPSMGVRRARESFLVSPRAADKYETCIPGIEGNPRLLRMFLVQWNMEEVKRDLVYRIWRQATEQQLVSECPQASRTLAKSDETGKFR
jgi:hypothetical protein